MDTSTSTDNNKRKLTEDDHQICHPRKHLRIEIPSTIFPSTISDILSSTTTSPSSLFSAISPPQQDLDHPSSATTCTLQTPALLIAPPISGLYFNPGLEIPADLADSVFTFFNNITPTYPKPPSRHIIHSPTPAYSFILNLYTPGEGIASHVDLLKRFGDGIIGVSLGSGCVMRFARTLAETSTPGEGPARLSIHDEPVNLSDPLSCPESDIDEGVAYNVYLPERSVLVLSSDARYKWTHGIEKRKSDFISCPDCVPDIPSALKGRWVERGTRLSITYRWLLPGADVVGCDE
ncbi:hypothetical protein Agabi119p4_4043 [Agaricus bisporus var. burnettii]|uniref:Fe2OG dioxygenase domain-containing protein n=1 Tax=Agaricus bisporus var. burnettii TaxID=192524 RepID=A0A8H7KGY8_AGABI|nr:hypothetical protein Agabi119p4_4043 [Agaricus bisporus var. burnettii]